MPKMPKLQRSLGRAALERYMAVVRRFYQHTEDEREQVRFFLANFAVYEWMPVVQREKFRCLLDQMKRVTEERDRRWWRLPPSAYDGELHFFDSKDGLRNVPLKKKKRPVL